MNSKVCYTLERYMQLAGSHMLHILSYQGHHLGVCDQVVMESAEELCGPPSGGLKYLYYDCVHGRFYLQCLYVHSPKFIPIGIGIPS